MNDIQITPGKLADLKSLYLDIYTCSEYDCEVNVGGRGTNPGEALTVIEEIYSILGLVLPKYTEEEIRGHAEVFHPGVLENRED